MEPLWLREGPTPILTAATGRFRPTSTPRRRGRLGLRNHAHQSPARRSRVEPCVGAAQPRNCLNRLSARLRACGLIDIHDAGRRVYRGIGYTSRVPSVRTISTTPFGIAAPGS